MSFPLIIEGYKGEYCHQCTCQQAFYPWYEAKRCTLFGEIQAGADGYCRRHPRCIQMEQKYKEKKNES